ncbi:hypothetical protein DFH09DRAFT_1494649 [Mycena vulgaris]|nr:hypothetical protein DFH09DRAFT_1494649 [Mycena vulgaris]
MVLPVNEPVALPEQPRIVLPADVLPIPLTESMGDEACFEPDHTPTMHYPIPHFPNRFANGELMLVPALPTPAGVAAGSRTSRYGSPREVVSPHAHFLRPRLLGSCAVIANTRRRCPSSHGAHVAPPHGRRSRLSSAAIPPLARPARGDCQPPPPPYTHPAHRIVPGAILYQTPAAPVSSSTIYSTMSGASTTSAQRIPPRSPRPGRGASTIVFHGRSEPPPLQYPGPVLAHNQWARAFQEQTEAQLRSAHYHYLTEHRPNALAHALSATQGRAPGARPPPSPSTIRINSTSLLSPPSISATTRAHRGGSGRAGSRRAPGARALLRVAWVGGADVPR